MSVQEKWDRLMTEVAQKSFLKKYIFVLEHGRSQFQVPQTLGCCDELDFLDAWFETED